ncbi:MAG: hypothetical protein KJZ87_28995, partial [Thermoguttaceae bacterium]|nr:hypothetical protein [Thermoguttaceae bacterium]
PYGEFMLGGIYRLSAYQRDRFRGPEMLYGGVGVLHQVAELPFLVGGPIYANGTYEVGGAFPSYDQADFRHSLSLGIMAETLFGPAYVGYSYGEGGSNQLQFSIGKVF